MYIYSTITVCTHKLVENYETNLVVVVLSNHVTMESYQRLIYVSLYWFIEGFKQCLLGAAQTLTMNPNNYQSKDGKRESGNRKNSRYS